MLTKRSLCLLLALAVLCSLAACGKTEPAQNPGGTQPAQTQPAEPQTPNNETEKPAASTDSKAEASLLPGTLTQLGPKEELPVLRGLWLAGNQLGSTEFNTGKPDVVGIRCIFLLNEWVELYPDADEKEGLELWVLKHREKLSAYENERFSEEMEGWVLNQPLRMDPDAPENPWASFYLNPEEVEPGYYDLLFTLNGKAVAATVLRFYAEGELDGKSDAELTELMKGLK